MCDRTSGTLHLSSTDCRQPASASSFFVDVVRELDNHNWTGPYCRKVNMNCDGDNSDTALFYSHPVPLDSGQVYAVVDTLATQTGNATYVGLSINDAASLFTSVEPPGHAAERLRGGYASTVKNTGKFFVHYYTRNCNVLEPMLGMTNLARDCTPVTTAMVPPHGDPNALGTLPCKACSYSGSVTTFSREQRSAQSPPSCSSRGSSRSRSRADLVGGVPRPLRAGSIMLVETSSRTPPPGAPGRGCPCHRQRGVPTAGRPV